MVVIEPQQRVAEEAILLFVRYPEAGRCKTRLIPALGADGAAELSRKMAERVAATVLAVDRPDVVIYLYYDPPERRDEVAAWLGPEFRLLAQPAGDLGRRLRCGFATAFEAGHGRVLAVGTDCLELTPALVESALAALEGERAVVGPAEDGGYYLIGLSTRLDSLFDDVPWSTNRTFEATMRKLRSLGVRVSLLPALADVDRPSDLRRAAVEEFLA